VLEFVERFETRKETTTRRDLLSAYHQFQISPTWNHLSRYQNIDFARR
jgi:hypothetical protein